ncbi:MAG: U32 family peptidase [Deltaproteobacteria bacterium]|jgi:putative protease|nr:U32 family peptidase [Deltaproteobacteria bacterium]
MDNTRKASPRAGAGQQSGRPELLAPAGGQASWAAALEAGADAVYLGLNQFSARSNAENFTLGELKGAIEESRRVGVKVYLAFNSLIKEGELAAAFKTVRSLAEMEPDAFIVQDLGLASLCRELAPDIPLHASTLTAVHTLDGLAALSGLGFSRAVLPRELNISEIALLSQRSALEVEVFVHGALCFSFSGLCLMSSFLGGRSALRGGCAQPCRRFYQNAGRRQNFFSLSDFMGLRFVPELRKLPIAALKIEGRMKGPDYVSGVVKAYKLMLEAPEARLKEAYEEAVAILRNLPGRPPGPGFMAGDPFAAGLWETQNPSGLKLGRLRPTGNGQGEITLLAPLKLLDRLRFSDEAEEDRAYKLRKMERVLPAPSSEPSSDEPDSTEPDSTEPDSTGIESAEAGETVRLYLGDPNSPPPETDLFKIGSGALEKELLASDPVKRLRAIAKNYSPPTPGPLPSALSGERGGPAPSPGRTQPLWLWVDGFDHVQETLKFKPRKIIVPLTAENAKKLGQYRKLLAPYSNLVWSLPPITLGGGLEKVRREAKKLIEAGHRDFMVASLGQIPLLNRLHPGLKLWGDHHLGVLNHLAGQALADAGLTGVTVSMESDQATLLKLSQAPFPGGVLMYLYGRPALFTSRYRPPSLKRGPVVSQRGEKFWTAEEGDAFALQSEHRVFIGGLLKTPKPKGFVGLIVDLRREPNPVEAGRRLRKAIDQGRGSPGLSFNFKRGLQ